MACKAFCDLRAVQIQLPWLDLTIIFSSLQYDPLTPVSATLELLLVEDVTVAPDVVTIFNHPDVRVSARHVEIMMNYCFVF